jgi:hypothetical protein
VCFFFVAVLALHPSEYMCPEGPGTPTCWDPAAPHFFKMPVLMLILITVLNDGTLCTIAYDHVVPSNEPEKWNLPVLWIVSFFLAMVAMASSLLLLWAGLDSNNPNGAFAKFGLPRMYFANIITMMYLKVGGAPQRQQQLQQQQQQPRQDSSCGQDGRSLGSSMGGGGGGWRELCSSGQPKHAQSSSVAYAG